MSAGQESDITANNGPKGGPNPSMAMAMDNNLFVFNEVGGVIDEFVFKRMTGEDDQYNRKLNDNGGTGVARYKPLILSNFPPIFRASDDSIPERLVLLYMKSVWVDNAPISEEEQFKQRRFKRDRDFDLRISKMASAALWYLVYHYKIYMSEGLIIPQSIQEDIDQYWRTTDIIGSFITDKVTPSDNEADKKRILTLNRIEEEYKKWMANGFPEISPLDQSKLLVILKQRFKRYEWGEYNGSGWAGLRIKHATIKA